MAQQNEDRKVSIQKNVMLLNPTNSIAGYQYSLPYCHVGWRSSMVSELVTGQVVVGSLELGYFSCDEESYLSVLCILHDS